MITWYHLLIMSMLQGVAFALMMPARQAIIPQVVDKDQLTNALALNSAAMSGTTLLAPALAGGLYAWAGPDYVYYLIGGLGAVSVVVTGLVPKTGRGTTRPAAMLSDIKEGLVYMKESRIIIVLLFMSLIGSLLSMPFWFLLPVFVVDVYDRGPEAMGLLVSVMGAGSLIGSLGIASIGQWKRGLLLLSSTFVSGVSLLLVAGVPVYYAAAAVMIPLGLGDSARWTLNQALIMEQTQDRFRGRVMSVFAMTWGLMPLAVLPTESSPTRLAARLPSLS